MIQHPRVDHRGLDGTVGTQGGEYAQPMIAGDQLGEILEVSHPSSLALAGWNQSLAKREVSAAVRSRLGSTMRRVARTGSSSSAPAAGHTSGPTHQDPCVRLR